MKSLIPIAIVCMVALFCNQCSAQLFRPAPAGINWNQECAIQSAQQFAACRQAGGNRWGCLAQAGLNYWICSDSNFDFTSQRALRRGTRLRAVIIGARVTRRVR